MKCPNCNANLLMTDRHGVEIDYCPQCRGVWLDRGELDKIIERSAGAEEAQRPMGPSGDHHGHDKGEYYRRKKCESFLGDLFDF